MPRQTNEIDVKGAGVKIEFSNAYTGAGTAAAAAYQTGTWARFGGETAVTPNTEEAADIKTSITDTDAHTYIAGKSEPGTIQFTAKYTDARWDALQAIAKQTRSFRILLASNSGFGVQGYLKSLTPAVDIEGLATINGVIKCSGPSVAISV